ncbi:MAG: AbrB/MazE/SpoVT family DNA-binding domain-containing protein [Candidatus Korarchaeum sp.]|nr:AbrB/MazE/SpoVT family DNA-binding domain-containing protein [Candidatus Korarchaeum sp.]MDW8035214.1 AbrB/MazE/SpoVT family DNA-binding domain-containing protein [Candidatus Korarchaeum sp.]
MDQPNCSERLHGEEQAQMVVIHDRRVGKIEPVRRMSEDLERFNIELKGTIVMPKRIAEKLGIREGDKLKVTLLEGKILIEPERDAIWLALHGRKFAGLSLEELESESFERQREYIEGTN